ncbi:MAG: phasin superfamily protein [Deltaproteobacteria bacterium]|nr:phasin superfamily protein [Deltaproteobacteria bacterium]
MFDLLEKAFLAGLGAVSLSRKKTDEFLAEMKEKYQMTEEEGKAFIEKAEKMAREGKERVAEMVDAEVKKVVDRIGLVPREEFDRLQKRIEELEEQLRKG